MNHGDFPVRYVSHNQRVNGFVWKWDIQTHGHLNFGDLTWPHCPSFRSFRQAELSRVVTAREVGFFLMGNQPYIPKLYPKLYPKTISKSYIMKNDIPSYIKKNVNHGNILNSDVFFWKFQWGHFLTFSDSWIACKLCPTMVLWKMHRPACSPL